ncbi:MAG: hypothetical protein A2175_02300 [Candidatus Nealsonbacteria bacterium RBG_13_42_11]|uniref:Uncharacterized protein n=1 Tax=Candidatus Nealsonbacteria bacterium RBG_13_42_11 TaxID=1801663 RepID=A0A1G2DZJ9_9BACT|nr:MAG: hypothetical protein A2175_02300 [Candidatus Nealsonbacteria bacterium RBG_13_42_11]
MNSAIFTKNTAITFFTRFATGVFSVLATIVIARTLGPQGQGIYSLAIMFSYILLIFTALGINPASVFLIGKKKYSPQEVLGNNLFLNLLISLGTVLIGLIIVFLFSNALFPGVEKTYLLLVLLLVPLILIFDLGCHILIGLQEIKKYNYFSFLQNGLFLLLLIIFLLGMNFGITIAIISQILSFILVGLFLFLVVKKEAGGMVLHLSKKYLKEIFSYGIKVHLSGIFHFLHYRIDLFLLNIFINPVAVGLYFVATKLAEVFYFLSNSTGTVLFSKIASETDEKQINSFTPIVCRNVLFITFWGVLVLLFLGQWLITFFYSKEFLDSVAPFRILLIGTLVVSGWEILANDFAARGKPILNTYIIGASVLINIVLNILFIPKWGISGAAIATAISYFFMFFVTVIIYSKISRNKIKNIIFLQKKDIEFYKNLFAEIKKRI